MSEPTKEQLAEAQKLGHDHGCLIEMDCTREHGDAFSLTTESLAMMIADVRTQATNDTLERAALSFGTRARNKYNLSEIAFDLRAMKEPTK